MEVTTQVKGPEHEVTMAGEEKDMEAGAKSETSVDKEIAGDLLEKEVPVARKKI